ncbi:MAG TPA: isochorismatase [Candidatus Methylomirabilis sp.]|nr:isochorismatase [Candidatus Methylomirabilis sp.]
MTIRPLPIPPHFDANGVGKVWRVPYEERAEEAAAWARRHSIPPAAADKKRVCLVIVDCQNTFCIPEFELFVGGRSGQGAVVDNVRLCQFIYRNLGVITEIVPTMDTHTAMQIFHPVFWVNQAGEHPKPHTVISLQEVQMGAWMANPDVAPSLSPGDPGKLQQHAVYYVKKLTERGKYPLMVWPYHSMLGGIGHALVSAVEEALFFHCLARKSQTRFEIKGDNPRTEHYSVLHPEIREGPDGEPLIQREGGLLARLLSCDAVIIAGQAKSHCVAWTIDDLLTEVKARNPKLVEKVYLLADCTSPVVVSGVVDFTDQADAAFQRFADAGMHVVRSTDPIDKWPGLDL